MKLDLQEEKKLWDQGYSYVVGLDEAGRGPLAGPVVAGAVMISTDFSKEDLEMITVNDSKKLSEKKREEIYTLLTHHPKITFGVGIVDEATIDKINILQATKLAMQRAIEKIPAKFLLLDGNFNIASSLPQQAIIKGDQKVFSIAAASIIAKVTRDRIMQKMHEKYPDYGFDKHKGYGTALHIVAIKKYGPCPLHRKTFAPILQILAKN